MVPKFYFAARSSTRKKKLRMRELHSVAVSLSYNSLTRPKVVVHTQVSPYYVTTKNSIQMLVMFIKIYLSVLKFIHLPRLKTNSEYHLQRLLFSANESNPI